MDLALLETRMKNKTRYKGFFALIEFEGLLDPLPLKDPLKTSWRTRWLLTDFDTYRQIQIVIPWDHVGAKDMYSH